MKNRFEQTPTSLTQIAQSPWIQGPFLGASVMAMVTPLLNWTNYSLTKSANGSKASFKTPMLGVTAYAASAVPGYATTFVLKELLKKPSDKTSKSYDLFSSFSAGGISGLICTPFESVAQNKYTTESSSYKHTAMKMIEHHGALSLFRGGSSIMAREGLWSTVYMTAIPMMSKILQEKGVQKSKADFLSVLMVAGAYGLISSPLNQMRFKKLHGLTEASINKSYLEHAKDIFNQDPKASTTMRIGGFFKGCFPRTVTTMVASGLLFKGTEFYDQAVNKFSK